MKFKQFNKSFRAIYKTKKTNALGILGGPRTSEKHFANWTIRILELNFEN